jgi:hypothetical protein
MPFFHIKSEIYIFNLQKAVEVNRKSTTVTSYFVK